MHFSTLLVGVAALLPAALAEITPPANFVLQAKSIKGVSSNNLYNKEYMFTEFANPSSQVPLFTRINGYAQFFQLVDPDKSTNGTFYTLQSTPSYSATYIAEMDYKDNEFASWHPVNFVLPKKGVPSTVEENGFYIGGTESFMELMWTNKVKKPANGDFSGWLSKCNSYRLVDSRMN